jgi:class 3 adenylate cyclase
VFLDHALVRLVDVLNTRPIRSASERPCSGFGDFVAKYMGDGVLIYFGYPQAHEDDAELAVGLR